MQQADENEADLVGVSPEVIQQVSAKIRKEEEARAKNAINRLSAENAATKNEIAELKQLVAKLTSSEPATVSTPVAPASNGQQTATPAGGANDDLKSLLQELVGSVKDMQKRQVELEIKSTAGEILSSYNGELINELLDYSTPEKLKESARRSNEAYKRYFPAQHAPADTQVAQAPSSTAPVQPVTHTQVPIQAPQTVAGPAPGMVVSKAPTTQQEVEEFAAKLAGLPMSERLKLLNQHGETAMGNIRKLTAPV